ncbi:MAG: exosortase/archaeosortase family protein [Dysgonamonadaceae bacterium]|jgi:exosortase/archaeosortase family protein|nr:exosortase/archaeosortase family protein [Dysgonamonadaceae bacterium]
MKCAKKLLKVWDDLTPFKSIIYFLFLLFFFHFSWKIAIDGDRKGNQIFLFGEEITIEWLQHTFPEWLANSAACFVHLFPGMKDLVVNGIRLVYPENVGTTAIVWGCTGVKQMMIFVGIMVFYKCFALIKNPNGKGYVFRFLPYWNKLWYIPLGCIILTLYNIIRIGSISMLTRLYPDKFDFFHDGIFRYIYYGIVFILWVVWEEVFVQKKKT